MDTNKKIREHVSALCDGELADEDVELGLAALRTEAGAAAWKINHAIGDALRELPSVPLSPDFEARLKARLDREKPGKPSKVLVEEADEKQGQTPRCGV